MGTLYRLGCCLCLLLAGPSIGAEEDASAMDRARFIAFARSVVKVEAVDPQGSYHLGTGVAVAPGTVITNCHVTRFAQSIRLVKGGLPYAVESEWSDLEHDLCLLYSSVFEAVPVPLSSADRLRLGQKVAAIGFTGGLELQVREGRVEGLFQHDGSKVIQTSTAFTSGASGGGLFDEDGRLVGILTYRLRGVNGYYFSTPVDWFMTHVADRSSYALVHPLAGPDPFWQEAADGLPYFMQASALASDKRWLDVIRLTDRWSNAEIGNAEPWFARGNAFAHLQRSDAAIESYREAVKLDPQHSLAWFNLGLLYQRRGDSDKVHDVGETLRNLDQDLFRQLDQGEAGHAKN